jgi:putative transposase
VRFKQAWLESGGVYGYRKLTLDMCDMGEQCSRHRVARLLRCEGIKAQRGYGKRPRIKGAAPAVVAPNLLSQQFTVTAPNKVWVTDITYISTHEGWLYLATVIDLFSRQVIGWATGSRIDTQLPLDYTWLSGAEGHERPSSFIQTKAGNLQATNGRDSWPATT